MANSMDVRGQYTFETFMRNGKRYKRAYGWLGMPNQVATHRSTSAQRGVAGGTGDDAGHLIGNRFGASGATSDLSVVSVAAALAGKSAAVGLITAGLFPREMALEPDGQRLLVTNFASGQLEAVSIPSIP